MEDLIAQTRARREADNASKMDHAKDIQLLQKHDELKSALSDVAGSISRTIMAHKPVVTVANPVTSVKTPDVAGVIEAVNHLATALKPIETDWTVVTSGLNALIPELKAIPGAIKIPEAPESVTLSNIGDITSALEALKGSVDKQLAAFKPKIEVKSPTVNVDAPDLSPLEAALESVRQAVDNIKLPEAKEPDLSPLIQATEGVTGAVNGLRFPTPSITPTDPLVRFAPADIDDAGTVQYYGYTDMNGHWYVQRMDSSATPKTLRYARGTTGYATGWTNRATLTYDYLHVIFGG